MSERRRDGSDPAVRISGLRKQFGPKTAVDGLDLELTTGELFCLLGPNGAGKTTTLKILTGLMRPTAGRALVGGFDVHRQPTAAKRLLGYVPDHPHLYDKLTGRELMRFIAGLYRLPQRDFDERTGELFATFELTEVADRLVESYSHGMRQKLSFAACFLHGPEVVVVDEPWVGLDPKNIHAVKRYLRARVDDGLTVLMSTHSLTIAEELADRVGILHRGRLLGLGTVAEVTALAAAPTRRLEDVFLELTREDER